MTDKPTFSDWKALADKEVTVAQAKLEEAIAMVNELDN